MATLKSDIDGYHVIIAAMAARSGGVLKLTDAEQEAVHGASMDIDTDENGNTTVRVYAPESAS